MTRKAAASLLAPTARPRGEFLCFSHEAMMTDFEIFLPSAAARSLEGGERYAAQAAEEAFGELERLESELSRFRETSDIARLARLRPGEALILGVAAYECFLLARRIHAATAGAFDVAIGRLTDCWRAAQRRRRTPSPVELAEARRSSGLALVEIIEESHAVSVKRAGVQVDLGGIGKGYALDKMAELLQTWGIEDALLNAGQSTVLATGQAGGRRPEAGGTIEQAGGRRLEAGGTTRTARREVGRATGPAGWPILLRDPLARGGAQRGAKTIDTVRLRSGALSGSGQSLHGPHIIDPRTGRPAAHLAAWAMAPTAAEADALSTAFMVMSAGEVEALCERCPEVSALQAVRRGRGATYRTAGWRL